MPHGQLPIAAVLAATLLGGCGGPESGLSITMSTKQLAAPLTSVRIDLHTPDRDCDTIFASGTKVMGSYTKTIVLSSPALTGTGDMTGIFPGSYNLFVWGFVSDRPVAWACGLVMIQDGKRTIVPVIMTDI